MVGSIRRGDGRLGQGACLCGASNRNGGGQRRWVTHTREMGAEEGVLHRMEGLPARFHEASSLGNPEREGAADLGVRRRPPRRPFGASDPRQDRPLSVSGRLSEQNSTPCVLEVGPARRTKQGTRRVLYSTRLAQGAVVFDNAPAGLSGRTVKGRALPKTAAGPLWAPFLQRPRCPAQSSKPGPVSGGGWNHPWMDP